MVLLMSYITFLWVCSNDTLCLFQCLDLFQFTDTRMMAIYEHADVRKRSNW